MDKEACFNDDYKAYIYPKNNVKKKEENYINSYF